MLPYTDPIDSRDFVEHLLSGRIKQYEDKWYWTQWCVGYSQTPSCHQKTFLTREEADTYFTLQLANVRKGFANTQGGRRSGQYTESGAETPVSNRIRFQSLRKSGKPGTVVGLLFLHYIDRRPNDTV